MVSNTQDLSKFGLIEKEEAGKLLVALSNNKTTDRFDDYFEHEGVAVEFNPDSGMVFLVNSNYEVGVLIIKDKVELVDLFLSCPYNGFEGTMGDLLPEYERMHDEDKEFLRSYMTDDEKTSLSICIECDTEYDSKEDSLICCKGGSNE